MNTVICVNDLGKKYRIHGGNVRAGYRTLRDSLGGVATKVLQRRSRKTSKRLREIWALRDVCFDVRRGDVVGLIGHNGAGKSTLLKILSRITRPTTGDVRCRGRVGSLLEVGTGFHPELTGRENIYLNGSILNMSRREIDRKFDAMVEFAGIGNFLETPVKRYSSGMRVRLAFSVAAHLEPDILIVDEVLAVGDLAFQQKCLARMGEVASAGRTVLFASHNMPALESLCTRALLFSQGELVMQDDTRSVIERYVRTMMSGTDKSDEDCVDLLDHPNRTPASHPILSGLSLLDSSEQPAIAVPVGSPLHVDLAYDNADQQTGLGFAVILCTQQGQRLITYHSRIHSRLVVDRHGSGVVRCTIPEIPLLPGNYRIDVAVGTWNRTLDQIEYATTLSVVPADYFGTGELPDGRQGLLAVPCHWSETTGPPALPSANTVD